MTQLDKTALPGGRSTTEKGYRNWSVRLQLYNTKWTVFPLSKSWLIQKVFGAALIIE